MSYEQDLAGFDPLAFAQRLTSGAERLATNLQAAAGKIQSIQAKGNAILDTTTRSIVTAGEVAKATTRAGIATAATGDAASGNLAASITSKPMVILLAAGAGVWLLTNRSGRGSRRSW